jgi:alpha/beta superfamily hydrolase
LAEELNKSRHVAAAQARAFAAAGYSVLQIDLYGCGDSSGDFGEPAGQSGTTTCTWPAPGWRSGSTAR